MFSFVLQMVEEVLGDSPIAATSTTTLDLIDTAAACSDDVSNHSRTVSPEPPQMTSVETPEPPSAPTESSEPILEIKPTEVKTLWDARI